MANGYDRVDNDSNGGASFVLGLLTGTVLGVGLGMLFAPKAGSELRGQISEQAANLATPAQGGYQKASEAAGQWAERGKEAYGKARETVTNVADAASTAARNAVSSTGPGGSRLS